MVGSSTNGDQPVEKIFIYDFYHTNNHCQRSQVKNWEYTLPAGWVPIEAPIVTSSHVSTRSEPATVKMQNNKIVVSAKIKNNGENCRFSAKIFKKK